MSDIIYQPGSEAKTPAFLEAIPDYAYLRTRLDAESEESGLPHSNRGHVSPELPHDLLPPQL